MVTILSPGFRLASGTEQERITSPLICTEQAPHCAMPQPYLVPVRPICSRITHRSGGSGSACTSCVFPLTLSLAMRDLVGWLLSSELNGRGGMERCACVTPITRDAAAPLSGGSLLRGGRGGNGGA